MYLIFFFFFSFLFSFINKSKATWQDRALRSGYTCSSSLDFFGNILSHLQHHFQTLSVSTEIAVGSFVQKLAGIGSRSLLSKRDSSRVPRIYASERSDKWGSNLCFEKKFSFPPCTFHSIHSIDSANFANSRPLFQSKSFQIKANLNIRIELKISQKKNARSLSLLNF